MATPISLTQVASTLGVHRNTVAEWLKLGCPCVTRASRDDGVEWQLDTAAVFKWRVDQAVKEALASYAGQGGTISKDEADRRRAVANAISAEVEADEKLRNVVSRHDVEATMGDFCQVLRNGLNSAGAKIAGRAGPMTNPSEIRDLCDAEINRALKVAEQDIAERWAADLAEPDMDSDQP